MPPYSGGNRWVGIAAGHSPPPYPTLMQLAERNLAFVDIGRAPDREPVVEISPSVKLEVSDLRQVLREIGRAYHYLDRHHEADVCKRLVKQLLKSERAPLYLPSWLRDVISAGFENP